MSRKEKEVVVRLSEADLRAVEYIGEFLGVDVHEDVEEIEKEAGEEDKCLSQTLIKSWQT